MVAALAAAVASAKDGDPLAPVTVVAPSAYAARWARRALGTGAGGRRGIANVACAPVDQLVRQLGGPVLAARGLRPAPRAVDLEAIRDRAGASPGWLGDLVTHRHGLQALRDACTELRRCPAATVTAFGRRSRDVGALARLVDAVREHLHDGGFADDVDLVEAATGAATAGGDVLRALGPLVCLDLGPLAAGPRRVLEQVGARTGVRRIGPGPGGASLTEVRTCSDPDEEVRTAVRSVLAAMDRGVPAWRQAVLHPAGHSYGRAVHQELAAAGVAANGPQRRRLDRSVAGAALLGLLELATSDWGRDEVTAWLSSAPIVTGGHGGAPLPVPARRWDALSADAGVVGGTAQWSGRLADLARCDPGRAGEATALGAFVDGLVAATTPPGASWARQSAWAVALLDRYLDDTVSWPPSESAAAAQVRGSVLALHELDAVSGGVDLDVFRQVVRSVLEESPPDASDPAGGGPGDGVFVAPTAFGRGLRFDGVVLLGMADAVVPGAVDDDALLPEDVRRLDISGGLRTRAERRAEMLEGVRSAGAAGARRRMATVPRVDPRTGRRHVRSRWLTALTVPTTRWRSVDSFAAGVAAADPPLSRRELGLRAITRWAAEGHDPARSPLARGTDRLATGITAARDRAGGVFTRFDGNVGPGRVSPFSADDPLSATRLETYAKCPRRFLFGRVLMVSSRTRPEDIWQMEPAARGTLVHAVLEAYLLERLEGAPRSLERLIAVADEQFDAAERGGLVGKTLLWKLDRAAMHRDLRRFHEEEGDLEPLAAELDFGSGAEGADPPVTVALGNGREVRFKGKADRVDRSPSGELVVSDYKTGRQRGLADLRRDPVAGGRLLQLPIYAMAARARFGGDSPVLARYWLLSEQRVAPSYNLTVSGQVQARFLHVLGLLTDAIEAGVFPGAPSERTGERQFEACRTCDLDRLCPATRDRQWARKSGDPVLSPVHALVNAAVPDDVTGVVVAGIAGGGTGP